MTIKFTKFIIQITFWEKEIEDDSSSYLLGIVSDTEALHLFLFFEKITFFYDNR